MTSCCTYSILLVYIWFESVWFAFVLFGMCHFRWEMDRITWIMHWVGVICTTFTANNEIYYFVRCVKIWPTGYGLSWILFKTSQMCARISILYIIQLANDNKINVSYDICMCWFTIAHVSSEWHTYVVGVLWSSTPNYELILHYCRHKQKWYYSIEGKGDGWRVNGKG